jgi:thiamine-phosphate pyrophosphorylase
MDLKSRLFQARLYLVMGVGKDPARSCRVAEKALRGGVDILQLRDHSLTDPQLLEAAHRFRALTRKHKALFIVNDRPDIAILSKADGVHVGQDDLPVGQVRKLVGKNMLIGLSTHAFSEAKKALWSGADYIGVGPVHATPTKEGRKAVGLGYVRQVAKLRPRIPFFAIGGIDLGNLREVLGAGASRIAVVRAITEAGDPYAVAKTLKLSVKWGSSPP